jgi:hypothetical protein
MHRSETFMQQTEPLNQVHENKCIGLIGEYYETITSTASAMFGIKTELFL